METAEAEIYERMWTDARPRLLVNDVCPDPPPVVGAARWGVSAILRPSGAVAEALALGANDIARAAGSAQSVYRPGTLHTTLRSFEGYRGQVSGRDERVRSFVAALRRSLGGIGSITIDYTGVTASASCAMACGWPDGGSLSAVRRRLHHAIRDIGPPSGPETVAPRMLAHASLVVFNDRLDDAHDAVRTIERWRHADFGRSVFTEVDVVRYERAASDLRVVVIDRVPLS